MNIIFRSTLVLGSVLLGVEILSAQAGPGLARTTGKVLILDNERALEGDIIFQGGQYCIRKGQGEIWLPAGKALCLCAGWDEALAFLKRRINLQDPDERLRLAAWCQQNGLVEQGLAEATVALDLRPGYAKAKQLQSVMIKELTARTSGAGKTPSPVAPVLPVDIGSESLTLFNNKIQPILLNTCASCHATGRGGSFQLSRPQGEGFRLAMQRNLSAVLGQINMDRPELSPLLIKAASAHGNTSQSPIPGGRKSVPYRTLESWVHMAVAHNPHLKEKWAQNQSSNAKSQPDLPAQPAPKPRSFPPTVISQASPLTVPFTSPPSPPLPKEEGPAAANPLPPARPVVHLPQQAGAKINNPTVSARAVPIQGNPLSTNQPAPAVSPARPDPQDPFDPEIFNQLVHQRK